MQAEQIFFALVCGRVAAGGHIDVDVADSLIAQAHMIADRWIHFERPLGSTGNDVDDARLEAEYKGLVDAGVLAEPKKKGRRELEPK